MKNIWPVIGITVLMLSIASAQNRGGKKPAPKPVKESMLSVSERGPHHKIWERIVYENAPDGKRTPRRHAFVELATGMHFKNEKGEWEESKEEIEILSSNAGAVATKGQHKVTFPVEIKSGLIELQTADGQWLRSRVWGLAYYDTATGESVLLAEVKTSDGQLLGDNVVNYPDAFTDFAADIRYTYTRAGFEQDVVLRGQPPAPEKFNLNPKTTRLQVLTEFVESPEPAKKSHQAEGMADETLGFGEMQIGGGKAFSVDSAGEAVGHVSVAKTWAPIEGRNYLIEEVRYDQVADQIQKLPEVKPYEGASLERRGQGENVLAGLRNLLPKRFVKADAPPTQKIKRLAKVKPDASPSFVMDYLVVASQTNFLFKGDTTYSINGTVNLSGTTTLEGGTVIKYQTNATSLNVLGSINCQTAPYRPAIFTAFYDNAVGETVWGQSSACAGSFVLDIANDLASDLTVYVYDDASNYLIDGGGVPAGNTITFGFTAGLQEHYSFYAYDQDWYEYYGEFWPNLGYGLIYLDGYGNVSYTESGGALCTPPANSPTVALTLANGGSVHDLQFRYLAKGLASSANYSVTNVQFIQCSNALLTTSASFYAGNLLLSDVKIGFTGNAYTGVVEHLTYDKGSQITGGAGASTLSLINSLLTGVTNNGVITPSFNYAYKFATNTGIYQTAGGGGYYLVNSSTNRNAGTTTINAGLLAQIGRKTTWPPLAYTNITFTTATNFNPQAQRDGDVPDLGYHYDPIDYSFGGCTANSNINFSAGTAVGWFRTTSGWQHAGHGVRLGDKQVATFNGTAAAPCYWVRLSTVQENDRTAGYGPGGMTCWAGSLADAGEVRARFTRCSMLNNDTWNHFRDDWGYLNVRATDCEFYGNSVGGYVMSLYFTNCLFFRNNIAQIAGDGPCSVVLRNCTLVGGALQFSPYSPSYYLVKDCAFDGMSIAISGYAANASYATYDYNSYTNASNPFPLGGSHNVPVTNFNWQSSGLGGFYLPTNSPLINTGSVSAASLALYHYTTQTNQIKETSSAVDIGYHYVAVNGGGYPLDSDGDLLPDYLEDFTGDGAYGAGDYSDWNNTDTDYDGRSDGEESVDNTNPADQGSVVNVQLGRWTFDNTNSWTGDQGQLPMASLNVSGRPSPRTNAVFIYSTNGAYLRYRDVEANGHPNINCQRGTMRYWFKPDWASASLGGAGPQAYGTMISFGDSNAPFGEGWWGFTVSVNGDNLSFVSKGPGVDGWGTEHFAPNISWNSNTWHQVALTYSATGTKIYLDGQYVTNGIGIASFPNATTRANGFKLGTGSGGNQCRGQFEDLETYNYELSAAEISSAYDTAVLADADSDGVIDREDADPTSPIVGRLKVTIQTPVSGSVIY